MSESRPQRSTRGKRVSELIGQEAEDDEEFWNHDTWADSSDDGGYSTEEEKPDVFDADFNDTEDESDSDEDAEERALRTSEKQNRAAETRKKTVYKEPGSKKGKKRVLSDPSSSTTKPSKLIILDPTPRGTSGKRAMRPRNVDGIVVESERSLRGSTAKKAKASLPYRKMQEAESYRKASSRQSSKVEVQTSFTQEELLTEAIQTEQANTRWILTAQRLAREREQSKRALGRVTGGAVRLHSKRSAPPTVTFAEVDAQPDFFRFAPEPPPAHRKGATFCAVTGLPAKYFDPVTKMPYANSVAFAKLRHAAGHVAQSRRKL